MAHVLIVEDNAELADNLCEILETGGHSVEWVKTAEDALTRIEETHFCGILTDLRLPKMNGLELIKALRSSDNATPIVLMTAFADNQATERARDLGALAVVLKPLDLKQLFSLIGEFSPSQNCILVLEDNKELAANISDALELKGFETLTVTSLQQALDLRRLPRVAVVDLYLPDGDGLSAVKRLRARDPNLAVVIMSGHLEEAAEGLRESSSSIRHVFPKPVHLDQLLQVVSREAQSARH